jgi:hypothetical protein
MSRKKQSYYIDPHEAFIGFVETPDGCLRAVDLDRNDPAAVRLAEASRKRRLRVEAMLARQAAGR